MADARERAVLPNLEVWAERYRVDCRVRQVTVGDYHLVRAAAGGAARAAQVVACVERKTLVDFGASLRDGRHGNIAKMRELRAATGCRLIYVVEGPAFPADGAHFARVPYANIRAAMNHLMLRDDVHLLLTRDEDDTARRLAELCRSLETLGGAELHRSHGAAEADGTEAGAAVAGGTEAGAAEGGAAGEGAAADGEGADLEVPAELTAARTGGDEQSAENAWESLRGVSLAFARGILMKPGVGLSIADVATGRATDGDLSSLKMPSGRDIHRDALSSLRGLARGRDDESARVLGGVRGLTKARAKQILAAVPLRALCGYAPAGIAMVSTPATKAGGAPRRVGEALAARLHAVLHWNERPRPAEAGAEAGAAGAGAEAGAVPPPAPQKARRGRKAAPPPT